jgi:excisionase family DNA binding protein
MKRFYRPDEVAVLLPVDKRTIYRWVSEGKLSGVKIGPTFTNGALRITKASLKTLIKQVLLRKCSNGDRR